MTNPQSIPINAGVFRTTLFRWPSQILPGPGTGQIRSCFCEGKSSFKSTAFASAHKFHFENGFSDTVV